MALPRNKTLSKFVEFGIEMGKIATITLFATLMGSQANALDQFTLFMVQKTLADHGYTLSKPDGLMGPATREALALFADDHGAPSDPDGAFQYMVNLSVAARRPVTDEAQLEKIRLGVAEKLRDPSSAMIRKVYHVTDVDREITCGEVNGKNAYGGYAGFVPFYGAVVIDEFWPYHIDGSDGATALLNCILAFPIKR